MAKADPIGPGSSTAVARRGSPPVELETASDSPGATVMARAVTTRGRP
jgi:hypothetical protein